MYLYICLFIFIFASGKTFGFNKPPPFIKACSRSNNFNECALKNGQEAIKYIADGNPKYHVPNMKPMKLDRVSLGTSENMKLYVTNMSIYGFELADLKKFDWDFEKKIVKVSLFFPIMNMLATYNMDGRILIMTLRGNGPSNCTFYESTANIEVYYNLERNNEKNYEYINLQKFVVKVQVKGAHFYFGNLLNNAQLSTQMNAFLNENWKFLIEDLYESCNIIMSTIVASILKPIIANMPYETVVKP